MKITRKNIVNLWALILCFAMVLPLLCACSSGGLELPTEEEVVSTEETAEEVVEQVQTIVTEEEETVTVDPSLTDPLWNYIPPENYIDYSDNESLNSTQNIGGTGTMKVTGGNPMMSYSAYLAYLQSIDTESFPASDRRSLALEEMRTMLTLKWTPATDVTYSYNAGAYYFTSSSKTSPVVNATNFAKNQIHLEAGKVYQGLPYTLGSANATAFTYGLEAKNGIYTVPVNERNLSGASSGVNYDGAKTAVSARLGVNDSDAVFWAWAPISSTIKFIDTASMTEANGVLSVGSYKLTDEAKKDKSLDTQTDDIVALNGEDTMYASYAAAQKADALVTDTDDAEHAMLIASVSVTKTADGKIDPNASYVTVLEQTDANLVAYDALSDAEKAAKKNEVLVIGGIDVKYTFAELFAAGYIPVTCKELIEDGSIERLYYADYYRTASSYTKSVLFTGYVYANRRIVLVNQVITDKDGKEVMNTTAFPTEMGVETGKVYSYYLSVWDDASEASRRYGNTSTSVMKSGEKYTCVLRGLLATGEIVTFRDYTFTF